MNWPRATKLRRLARYGAQRLAPGSVILLYHRIARAEEDPWSLCVSPEHFEQHLEVLRDRIVPLKEIAQRPSVGGRGAARFAITFDDGYVDVFHAAKPLLVRSGAPATVFVATEGVENGQPFWWDELVHLLAHVSRHGAAPGSREPMWMHGPGDSGGQLHAKLHETLGSLQCASRREHLAVLRAWAGVGAPAAHFGRCLTAGEIRQLAEDGLVEIGAHTVSHRKLPTLTPEEQEKEMRQSRRFLEALIQAPVTSFAYPHGCHDARSRRILAAAGFQRACTSLFARVRPGTDVLQLPRLTVPDCDGEAFARMLQRLGF